jgi:hypothetical protein
MGGWGTAISSNDTYADTYSEFFNLYNDGLDVDEISKKLIADNQETIKDTDNCNNFWFALAKAQWECKQLDNEIFDRVKRVIETGADLEVWRQLDADEKDIKKRKTVLEKFLLDLQAEKPKAKARNKTIIRQPLFEKGDCLTLKLANGNFGGAVVLEAIKDSEFGLNLIAATRINQQDKPTTKDFESAEVLILNYATWDNRPEIGWYYLKYLKKDQVKFEVVDRLKIEGVFSTDDHSKGFYFGGSGDRMKEELEKQFEFELGEHERPKTMKIETFLDRKKKWKFL